MDVRNELVDRTKRSKEIFEKSQEVLASEVVGTVDMPHPFYVAEAKGSRIVDVDGNEYIDLTMGFGPHLLGHAPDFIVEAVQRAAPGGLQVGIHNPHQERLARLIVGAAPANEQVVFANSGTEATLYAVRAARTLTGRTRVGIFDGSYHGVHDYVLAEPHRSSSREEPVPFPRSGGIPGATTEQISMFPYRSRAAFEQIRAQKDDLAVVLLEPAQSSNPRLDSVEWIRELREVCRECGVLFVMDEVITGFRLAYGGGQERFDIQPDFATYGKIIGGGLPVGAIAGPREMMRAFIQDRRAMRETEWEPVRAVFSGTTFGGNPMTMLAGAAHLEYLSEHRDAVYPYLDEQSDRLADAINGFCEEEGYPARMLHASSLFHLFFGTRPIESARDVDPEFREVEREFYLHLLYHGVIIPGLHLAFISYAHTPQDVDRVIEAMRQSFRDIRERGLV
ncbi:MAG: aspartate aminotransferase family protein [Planctomycetota bacterium]|jgi:glutamate-1-semialdehyde-2,1-aminomutase